MPVHRTREIENLKKGILTLGAMAEEAVHQATSAIENRDESLAQRVIENDVTLDEMEIRIEEVIIRHRHSRLDGTARNLSHIQDSGRKLLDR